MPHSTHGIVVLMGSGEMSPSMVEVHKYAMSLVGEPPRAVFIDTPAGFQLNADLIAEKAVAYFRHSLNTELTVVSFKSMQEASPDAIRATANALRQANYIFAGPGSPTYALRNWAHVPIRDAMFGALTAGGCLTFASAAALTLGRFTIPVYEVYKVGESPYWVEGLNFLGHNGLDVCVVPHWNNTSGGDHDTRFCFMGEPRWRLLEDRLPRSTAVLGIDEHTACILRLDDNLAQVRGVGQVAVRRDGAEQAFSTGSSFSLDLLRPFSTPEPLPDSATPTISPANWETLRRRYEALLTAEQPSITEMAAYIYDLMSLLSAAREERAWQTMRQAEEALREALVRLIGDLDKAPIDRRAIITPFVELLLATRTELREARQWALADRIRDRLHELGVIVEDGRAGSSWRLR